MSDQTFRTVGSAFKAMQRDARDREKRLRQAVRYVAKAALQEVKWRIPVAFGELRESAHIVEESPGTSSVRVDAPYAASVDQGSRPHTPPLEPLIHWVELRGQRGLTAGGSVKKITQTRWLSAAKKGAGTVGSLQANRFISIAVAQRAGRQGAAEWHRRASLGPLARNELGADPVTVQIARAIQFAIRKRGTKAVHFMRGAMEQVPRLLAKYVASALPDKD